MQHHERQADPGRERGRERQDPHEPDQRRKDAERPDRSARERALDGSGEHPLGTGAGAVGGAAAAAAIGAALGGPAGAAVGGILGALGGAAAGHGIAEGVNPAEEDSYWRQHYRARSYIDNAATYALYRPAYRFGWEARVRYFDRRWEDVEPILAREWETRHESELTWARARAAAFDAWQRVERKNNW